MSKIQEELESSIKALEEKHASLKRAVSKTKKYSTQQLAGLKKQKLAIKDKIMTLKDRLQTILQDSAVEDVSKQENHVNEGADLSVKPVPSSSKKSWGVNKDRGGGNFDVVDSSVA